MGDFEYVQSLCEAIAAYTAGRVATDPGAFTYRRANLRYAVERALYFRFVNDTALHAEFLAAAKRPGERAAFVQDALRRRFVGSRSRSSRRFLRPFGAAIRRAVGVRSRPIALRADAPPGTPPAETALILAHVIHEKFVRYLRPVFGALAAPYAYLLTPQNQELRPFMQSEQIPFRDWTDLPPTVERVTDALADFGDVIESYDRFHDALFHLRPACLVVVEGNAPQDETINQACAQVGIPTVCVQQGWSPFVHNGFRNMSYTRMTVWGRGFAELLQPHNPRQQFVAVGHHRLTLRQPHHGSRPDAGIGFFLQAPGPLLTEAAWSDFLQLIERTSTEFPSRRIVVREHPARPLSEPERLALLRLSNVALSSPAAETLDHVLGPLAVGISVYSTVVLESVAAGVIPLVVNLTSMPKYWPDVDAARAGVEVKTTDAALIALRRLLTDAAYRENVTSGMPSFSARYFDRSSRSAQRIAETIMSCASRETAAAAR